MRLALLTLLFATSASAQTGTLAGHVAEADGGVPLIGATVRLDGTTLGAAVDIDGEYRIVGVPPGTYSVVASFIGYETQTVTGVSVAAGSAQTVDFALAVDDTVYTCDMSFYEPLFSNSAFESRTLTGDEIERMPVRR